MPKGLHVLIVEDEDKLRAAIRKGLEERGALVMESGDGKSALELLQQHTFQVIVSDVIMPGLTGTELLKAARELGIHTPVLLLTALNQLDHKIEGFEAGADDYLTKPFDMQELIMRIVALGRRSRPIQLDNPVLKYEGISMDLTRKEVKRDGQDILLTPREYALMEYLLKNPERVVSKQEIAEKVWNLDFETGTNVIEVYVNFLRKKIDKDFPIRLIHTQFRTGYILKKMQ